MVVRRMLKIASRALEIEYAIRDVVVVAKELEKKGMEIIYLNIGDPLKYDFDTPEHIKEALVKAIREGVNWYSQSEGIPELREAICEKEKKVNNVDLTPENVIVTTGISEAIMLLMGALLEPGDEILIPEPTYPPYIAYAKYFGGKPISYRNIEEERWQPDIDDLRKKINEKTKAIVLINPNNPCGSIYRKKTLKKIVDIAGEENIPVISDEIYDRIVFNGEFNSTASISGEVPIVGLNGFSKTYLMTGWRLGYMYFYDPENKLEDLKEAVLKECRIRICANTPVQKAAIEALRGPQDHIRIMVEKLRERRDYVYKRLNEIEGLSCVKPEGAFYAFPRIEEVNKWGDDKNFVIELLKSKGVLLVHGSGFGGKYGFGHFRIVFLPPVEALEKAFEKIEEFMKSK